MTILHTERTPRTDLAARLVGALLEAAGEARVADVRIGLGYTAVRLSDGRTGVASGRAQD